MRCSCASNVTALQLFRWPAMPPAVSRGWKILLWVAKGTSKRWAPSPPIPPAIVKPIKPIYAHLGSRELLSPDPTVLGYSSLSACMAIIRMQMNPYTLWCGGDALRFCTWLNDILLTMLRWHVHALAAMYLNDGATSLADQLNSPQKNMRGDS